MYEKDMQNLLTCRIPKIDVGSCKEISLELLRYWNMVLKGPNSAKQK